MTRVYVGRDCAREGRETDGACARTGEWERLVMEEQSMSQIRGRRCSKKKASR